MKRNKKTPHFCQEWWFSRRSKLRVSRDTYEGRLALDVRLWYLARDGRWHATRRGITVDIRHLPRLAKALRRAQKAATKAGLLRTKAKKRERRRKGDGRAWRGNPRQAVAGCKRLATRTMRSRG